MWFFEWIASLIQDEDVTEVFVLLVIGFAFLVVCMFVTQYRNMFRKKASTKFYNPDLPLPRLPYNTARFRRARRMHGRIAEGVVMAKESNLTTRPQPSHCLHEGYLRPGLAEARSTLTGVRNYELVPSDATLSFNQLVVRFHREEILRVAGEVSPEYLTRSCADLLGMWTSEYGLNASRSRRYIQLYEQARWGQGKLSFSSFRQCVQLGVDIVRTVGQQTRYQG
ncbi:hypothetical protein KIPB_008291 [Kipferlia bialata]|uniref:Uncharacterized protein n=1 Tax=Kipferlia bialata TaxID=797122 RepID=A0A9K3D1G4_9EUKA|nr:hypothetical protein KIPB_008291 [Kipferlia bialata]|eukprot:g8291.t1